LTDNPKPIYGGQAVIEGVMMRGRKAFAIAMRHPDGHIVVETDKLSPIYQSRWARVPFLRGLVLLWDALALGSRALGISANLQVDDEEEQLDGAALGLTMLASLAFAVVLFFLIPAGVSFLFEHYLAVPPNWSNVIEGVVRLLILVGYMAGIGRIEDIARVYQYHGAEHKTINAYEADVELTPDNVDQFPLEHPRCGTAFLLTVVIFSVLIFSFIGPLPILPRLGLRLLLIPFLAGVAYEYLRWSAAHFSHPIVRVLVAPNLWMQRLTTRPPDKGMLEVAIASFNEMKALEDSL
jgi:uncharacterized protein YqhQ